jgi:hypothetical protein
MMLFATKRAAMHQRIRNRLTPPNRCELHRKDLNAEIETVTTDCGDAVNDPTMMVHHQLPDFDTVRQT